MSGTDDVKSLLAAIDEYAAVKSADGDADAAVERVRQTFNQAVFNAIDKYNDPYR